MAAPAQRTTISINQDTDRILSPYNVIDYFRVAAWFLWSPQRLKFYIRKHCKGYNNVPWRNLQAMTAVLWGAAVAGSGLAVGIILWHGHEADSGWAPGITVWMPAALLAVLVTTLSYTLLLYFDARDTKLLLVPTLGAYGMVVCLGYPRALQLYAVSWWHLALLYLVIGVFSGLLYSQVKAYRCEGMPYFRRLLVAGLSFAAVAVTTAFVANYIVVHWEPIPPYPADLVVVMLASFCGFVVTALRVDDWLAAWLRTKMSSKHNVYPPSVTPLWFGYVHDALATAAAEDWRQALTNAAIVWRYTWQHRIVAMVLYELLDKAPDNERDERLIAVTYKGLPWKKPILLVRGGKRSTWQLSRFFWRKMPQTEVPSQQQMQNVVDNFLVSKQVCQDAATIDDAIRDIMAAAYEPDQIYIVQILKALKKLKGDGSVVTGTRRLDDGVTFPKSRIPKADLAKPEWVAVNELLEIHYWAWLTNCCRRSKNRRAGAKHVLSLLSAYEQHMAQDAAIDSCIKKFLHEVIGTWRSDMQAIANRPGSAVTAELGELDEVNPFSYDEPIRARDRLFGRDRQRRLLRSAWDGSHMQVVEVMAPVLCGSTSLFTTVINDYVDPDGESRIAFAHVCLGHIYTDVQAVRKIAYGLYDGLSRYSTVKPDRVDLDKEPMRSLEAMIRDICSRRPLVVAFDDAHYLEQVLQQHQMRRFMLFIFHLNEVIQHFGVVLIGKVDGASVYRRLRPETTRFAKPIRFSALGHTHGEDALVELLNEPVPGFVPRFLPEAVARIEELSARIPYLVQLIAWNMYDQLEATYAGENQPSSASAWDPLYTKADVDAVLRVSAFRLGWKFYVYRISEYFGSDWDDVCEVINWYKENPGKELRPKGFVAEMSRAAPRNAAVRSLIADRFRSGTSLPHPGIGFLQPAAAAASVRERRPWTVERARALMRRLSEQGVLMRGNEKGVYRLRVGLMHAARLEALATDEDLR